MKNRNIFIALALFAGLSSCDDWIDKSPLSEIEEGNYDRDRPAAFQQRFL